MEIDPLQPEPDKLIQKSEKLKTLTNGSISTSISKLSGSSRVLPSEKDFHFYYNFDEFRASIDEIGAKSQSMLQQISSAKPLWGGKEMDFPQDVDDEAYDWLVNVNDEVIERFDVSVDEFSRSRKAEEEAAKARRIERKMVDENGFQLVTGKKKKGVGVGGSEGSEKEENAETTSNVRVVERDKKTEGPKSKIPFHIPTIRKPQEVYNILVNNSNTPFQHVWLERSEDGLRFVHPLEKLSLDEFLDCNIENLEPVKPPPLESTPFKFVEDVKELKELAAKLRAVNEFSVDLEHNQYRSFQGLTCLMQISTRTEDFVVDTFKLRIHIGPYLREIFKDPTKRKVMHGADRDIVWLQRDFGIYVCNLFDTGQASRVLQMERFSLEHLLQHFCGVTANKQYQNADWRLRPLPREMLRYAREDTHYLLYIYDLMRIRLLSESKDPENPKALLQEVYKRSYDVCMQLYEKELLTDTSYLYIYGVQTADLNAQQLSVISGLCEWRDAIARAEDESTGFILPNKVLLEIAKQMPLTTGKLRHTIKSKLPFVERNLGAIVSIIRHSVQNSSSFEAVSQQLKEGRIQMAHELNTVGSDIIEAQNDGDDNGEGSEASRNEHPPIDVQVKVDSFKPTGQNGSMAKDANGSSISEIKRGLLAFPSRKNVTGATVQLLKKPGRGFGALLGSSASKKNIDLKKEEEKLEEIKSSVSASFYSSFSYNRGPDFKEVPKQAPEEPKRTSNMEESPCERDLSSITEDVISLDSHRHSKQSPQDRNKVPESKASGSNTKLDDVILLDSESSDDDDDDDDEPEDNSAQNQTNVNSNDDQIASKPELVVLDDDDDEDDDNEPISLSDLSSSFQKCLQTANQNQEKESKETGSSKFQPFDYESARKEVKFGEEKKSKNVDKDDKNGGKKKSGVDRSNKDEGVLAQGKRRQAFPASGNRSATFR